MYNFINQNFKIVFFIKLKDIKDIKLNYFCVREVSLSKKICFVDKTSDSILIF